MKVVYFNYLFDKKESSVGANVHVWEFVRSAKQCGLEVKSFNLNKFDGVEQAEQSKLRGWLKKRLSRYLNEINALLSNVRCARKEWKIIKTEKPDAILVRYNLFNFSAALIARIKRIPFILEVNAPMALENRQFNHRVWHLPFLPEWIERLNLHLATRVYTVSEPLKSYFVEQGIPARKISVIANGVDTNRFHPNLTGTDIRKRFGLQDKIVIGFVGSFHYWHGLDIFEKYVAQLASKYSNVHFMLVGSGPLKDSLQQHFSKNGVSQRMIFTDYVPHTEVPNYLAAMDIVLAPYPDLAFFYFSPLKLFEYMAAAKPVIASEVGQIGEIVEDGVNGLLFKPGNLQEMIAKSAMLIENSDLRLRLGKAARKTVCNGFSWQVNAEKVRELVMQSLNGRS